ncbi:BofC C-terminal domain-containing protein, partial [Anaerosalibacter bizertensis]|nr:BofC C-terminal domain-containing protein [Anaerosalibacter bizertensis]
IKIIAFSTQKIVLREERNHLCPNHYVVGESEGKIAIFKINDSGEKVLDKIFNDYPLSLLKEVDQQKLKDGIVVDNEEELSDVLENFIS